jgi:hypothetical protein
MELGVHNRVYSAGEVPYADGGVSYQGETVLILCTSSHDNKFNPVQARECVEWQVPVSSPAPSVACMCIPASHASLSQYTTSTQSSWILATRQSSPGVLLLIFAPSSMPLSA